MTEQKLKDRIDDETKWLETGAITRERANEGLFQLLKDHASTQSERAKAVQRGVSSMESTRSLEINEAHYAKRLAAKDAEIAQWREQTIAASSEIDRLRIEAKRLRDALIDIEDDAHAKAVAGLPLNVKSILMSARHGLGIDSEMLHPSDGEKPEIPVLVAHVLTEAEEKERAEILRKAWEGVPIDAEGRPLDSPAPTEERLNEVLEHFKGLNNSPTRFPKFFELFPEWATTKEEKVKFILGQNALSRSEGQGR